MKIDVLFFDGCPHLAATVTLIRDVARLLGADVQVCEIEVKGPEAARRLRFPGSPTVRVDGEDIEPARRSEAQYLMGCRLYGGVGVPPRDLVEAAIARKASS